jgi:hypothetical protein
MHVTRRKCVCPYIEREGKLEFHLLLVGGRFSRKVTPWEPYLLSYLGEIETTNGNPTPWNHLKLNILHFDTLFYVITLYCAICITFRSGYSESLLRAWNTDMFESITSRRCIVKWKQTWHYVPNPIFNRLLTDARIYFRDLILKLSLCSIL